MALKASIFLLWIVVVPRFSLAGSIPESDLQDAIAKNDFAAQVSLLQSKKGQNFEQDFQLAKALIQEEKRIEGLKVLNSLYQVSKEERISKLIRFAGELFFAQETSNLYFEAVRLLGMGKYSEAKERLDQANSKESGNVLVITRLIQTEILMGAFDSASKHLKEVHALVPPSLELKVFALKLALINPETKSAEWRALLLPKRLESLPQVPYVFTLEAFKRMGRLEDIRFAAEHVLKQHPRWVYAMSWLVINAEISEALRGKLKTQIDRELRNRDLFEKGLKSEMIETQYYWVGYISYEDLVKNARGGSGPTQSD